MSKYRVTLCVHKEVDVLRRMAVLNSAMYRVLAVSQLKRVVRADYRAGELVMEVMAADAAPDIVPGRVEVRVEPA